jgi:hypothetical protein
VRCERIPHNAGQDSLAYGIKKLIFQDPKIPSYHSNTRSHLQLNVQLEAALVNQPVLNHSLICLRIEFSIA